jgi:sugar/nucleoside kinase (ribokinase family)
MTRRLVSVGNVLVDIIVHGRLPERGSDSMATSGGMSAGGAFNAMVAATRQGLPTAYAGGHGTGAFGDLVRAALRDAGIEILTDVSTVIDSGYDIAIIEDDGERTFLTVPGAEMRLTASQLERVVISGDDLLLVSGYGLLEQTNGAVLAPWLETVPAETTVLVDPGPLVRRLMQAPVWAAVAARADWLSCNREEAAILSSKSDPMDAASSLANGSKGVLVRDGSDGCVLAVEGQIERVPGFAVTAIDTNGAGDAHSGAFLAALAEGLEPSDAALRANACAAIAVTRRGPATAPTRAEVLALLAG